ncbi:MAG TPA: DUF4249 domain-containing protein [Mucilaginibacter sp.]|jgi:hypothetical protein
MQRHLITGVILVAIFFGCKEQYVRPVVSSNVNTLVVDGFINSGNDSTSIKLSRSVGVSTNSVKQNPEAKAQVTVESSANSTYPLKEISKGTYACGPLNLNKTLQYRLRIVTSDHKIYLSDFVEVKDSPVIDSLGYNLTAAGLGVYVNTHDDAANTRYYRWDYHETWEFHPPYQSEYIARGNSIVDRNLQTEGIFFCWQNASSSDIVLNSSAKLAKDVIFQGPIAMIPKTSEKLSFEYSILVKQYALTQDAFNYWQLLRNNTEQTGSIFDTQPSVLTGNIHNASDKNELVFGYVSVGSVRQKRMFVYANNLPTDFGTDNSAYKNCTIDTVSKSKWADYYFGPGHIWTPVYPVTVFVAFPIPHTDTTAFQGTGNVCADCTTRGTRVRPSFWQ